VPAKRRAPRAPAKKPDEGGFNSGI